MLTIQANFHGKILVVPAINSAFPFLRFPPFPFFFPFPAFPIPLPLFALTLSSMHACMYVCTFTRSMATLLHIRHLDLPLNALACFAGWSVDASLHHS